MSLLAATNPQKKKIEISVENAPILKFFIHKINLIKKINNYLFTIV